MAESVVNIPVKGITAPSNWTTDYGLTAYPEGIKATWEKYKNIINKYAKTSRIPPAILLAFIYIESGGKPEAVSPTGVNVGLMQWNYTTGHTIIENEFKAGRMSEAETEIIQNIGKRLGFTYNNGRLSRSFTKQDAFDSSLNVFVGSILLGQLIDSMYLGQKEPVKWATEKGKIRLDRVIVVYNAGGGGNDGMKARRGNFSTPLQLASAVNSESANYIRKIMGEYGALDIIRKHVPDASMQTI